MPGPAGMVVEIDDCLEQASSLQMLIGAVRAALLWCNEVSHVARPQVLAVNIPPIEPPQVYQ